ASNRNIADIVESSNNRRTIAPAPAHGGWRTRTDARVPECRYAGSRHEYSRSANFRPSPTLPCPKETRARPANPRPLAPARGPIERKPDLTDQGGERATSWAYCVTGSEALSCRPTLWLSRKNSELSNS